MNSEDTTKSAGRAYDVNKCEVGPDVAAPHDMKFAPLIFGEQLRAR
jgi:hypothetical protein